MKPVYRETLNFSKSELLGLQRVGIQIGIPTRIAAGTNIGSFGMFGDGNNMNTFYPGLTAADFMPKPEDMVDIPFRLISATIVGGNSWKATNFSNASILKDSMGKLANKPVFFDHVQDVPNWLGITVNPTWQDGFKADDGTMIPAGINGTHRIDAKSNPKIARGLVMGAIGSNSVTVVFDWQPSHTYENVNEFYDKMGTMDAKDGKMVCRNVTAIVDYHESSLVWLGADPFAKKMDSMGNPINVDKGSICYSKEHPLLFASADAAEKEAYEKEKKFTISYAIDENIISLSKQNLKKSVQVTLTNTKNTAQMNKILLAFLAAFAPSLKLSFTTIADGVELTPAQELELTTSFSKLGLIDPNAADNKKQLSFLQGLKLVNEKGELVSFDAKDADVASYHIISATEKERVYTLSAKATTLEPMAKIGTEHMKFKREETIRLYKLQVGTAQDPAVEALITSATPEQLEGLLKQYTKGATMRFSAFCTKCSSDDHVEMRSSIATGEVASTVVPGGSKSIQEMAAEKAYSGMVINRG